MENFEPVHNKALDLFLQKLKDVDFPAKITVDEELKLKVYDI